MRWFLRSKIHNAKVTEADPDYIGSIGVDLDLMEVVGLLPGEKVLVASSTGGARLETYVIALERGSGTISMNGGAALLIGVGERVIIMGFELSSEPIDPRVACVDEKNQFVSYL